MIDILVIIGGLIAAIGTVYIVAKAIENRVKRDGSLFAKPPTTVTRIVAIVLGLLFGGAFFAEIAYSNRYHVVFPLLFFALIAYGLGAYNILVGIQNLTKKYRPPDIHDHDDQNREAT